MSNTRYSDCVFINVPLDRRYEALLRAVVFAVHDCGFGACCATEREDGSEVRIQKLYDLIRESKYSIHDLSRVKERYNMPLELGIVLGAKHFGTVSQKQKRALILDSTRYRYRRVCSDISGQDVRAHRNQASTAIRCVRNWLNTSADTKGIQLPGPEYMARRYRAFCQQLPRLCKLLRLNARNLDFLDYRTVVAGWLKRYPRSVPA